MVTNEMPQREDSESEFTWRYGHQVDTRQLSDIARSQLFEASSRLLAIYAQEQGTDTLQAAGIIIREGKTRFLYGQRVREQLTEITIECGQKVSLIITAPRENSALSIQPCVWENIGGIHDPNSPSTRHYLITQAGDQSEIPSIEQSLKNEWLVRRAETWIQALYITVMSIRV